MASKAFIKKQQIQTILFHDIADSVDGLSLVDVINNLQRELDMALAAGYTDVNINQANYNEHRPLQIIGIRDESDEEAAARETREFAIRQERIATARLRLEREAAALGGRIVFDPA